MARSPCVLVVCFQPLRAASLVALLRDWADAGRMTLSPARPAAAREALDEAGGCALAILDIGSASLGDVVAAGWLQGVLQAADAAPVAVIADTEQPEEILAAVRAGARGFIPTSTAPEIALRAFSFIIGGGSFFPPGALLERFRPRAMRAGPDRAVPQDRRLPRNVLSEQ
ncbi:hypothetical protein [Falsiroseomonas sp. CW058]|uniref:hypothetical protein n=1 Tax=Falsiroseomonas sp. CW058 TaxID=3388664 RepID=UPI003D31C547